MSSDVDWWPFFGNVLAKFEDDPLLSITIEELDLLASIIEIGYAANDPLRAQALFYYWPKTPEGLVLPTPMSWSYWLAFELYAIPKLWR